MTMLTTRDASLPATYSDALETLSLGPLWTALHAMLPNERACRAVPHCWRWREVRPLLLDAAKMVPLDQAERRVLVLRNPGLDGAYAITSTLFAGLQIILPGETAPSHHHTPAALRLVVEGDGAYTTVEGIKCAMEAGDLIITPPMRWHDHGHEGREPMVWLVALRGHGLSPGAVAVAHRAPRSGSAGGDGTGRAAGDLAIRESKDGSVAA